ncbi:BatD family protein [Brachyspira hyodysenteriae]|nr:BatD family protein [Brachyspira hyodysenteriae]MBT8721058.1 BatD family protein [Brachyspira hyodysenteriae]MBT8731315.1 BatD family protein [Brachyspira hyodysenteriae]MBT8733616.1 BatD family protein [Brachyspira hyodysenteriae]MBT8736452.1 BatD family protein [Brachyspira hyodysenteriae]MBT8738783.1 BatD family protein [Brachyspira hyodysenteriae]
MEINITAEAELIRIGNTALKYILAVFFIAYSSLFSQTSINTKISDTKVGVGEVFTVSVTIDNSTGRVLIDDIPGLTLRGTSQSINMMYSSGTFKSIKTYNFTYVANSEGKYKFDHITVKINNRTYVSNPVEIEVVSAPTRNDDSYTPSGNRFNDFMNYADDIYVDNSINKKEVYMYEPIYITQKAYTHIPVTVLGFSKIPDRTDFISYSDSSKYNTFTEIIEGKRVSSIPLKREVLYPVKTGTKDILTTPFVFEKDGMFYDRVQYGEETFSIKVLPLPDKKGFENFSGGVGNFIFTTRVNRTNVAVGEELLITMEVSGEGNTSIITMPNINDNITNYFSVYQPKIYETNWFDDNKMLGRKVKEYILVAKNEGASSIASINFCYFSPNDKTYTNIHSNPISLTISGSKINNNSFVNNDGEEINTIAIRNTYLKEDKNFKVLSINIIYIYILILIIASLIIYNAKRFSNIKFSFAKKDNKDNSMDDILNYYNSNNRKEYCKSVENLLLTAVKNKFNIQDDNVLYDKLRDYIDYEKANEIKNIIDKCNFELYSGKSSGNEDYHTKSIELVKYIKELKIKK